jgi:hypothetical protein
MTDFAPLIKSCDVALRRPPIWHLYCAASPLLRLAELPMPSPIDPADFGQARSWRTP